MSLPERETVAVWLAMTDRVRQADAPWGPPEALCTAREHDRAGRFRDAAAGARWLAARGVLRHVLGTALGTDPAALEFAELAHGKPVLVGPSAHFSLSHAGELVAVAVAGPSRGPVGVDIEVPRVLRRPERLAERLLDDDDRADWLTRPESERTSILLQRWTRVEALLKATGDGVSGGIAGAERRLGLQGWTTRDLDLGDRAVGAVAALASTFEVDGPRWLLAG